MAVAPRIAKQVVMFCPRCGTGQAADNMRYCSRCGFGLDRVADLLSANVVQMPGVRAAATCQGGFRRITRFFGAKLVFASIFLTPVVFMLSIAFDSPGPLIVPLLLLISGLAHIAYMFIFGGSASDVPRPEVPLFQPATQMFELQPLSERFSTGRGLERVGTARVGPPPSVTEFTTNLLERTDS